MEPREARRDIQWGPLLGGVIVGWIASWGLYIVTVLVLFSSLGDVGFSGSTWPIVVAAAALFLPAVVSGVLLLRQRRAGQMVAGLLLGLAIGAVVGAGVCMPLVLGGG
jgi:hypothetical protein